MSSDEHKIPRRQGHSVAPTCAPSNPSSDPQPTPVLQLGRQKFPSFYNQIPGTSLVTRQLSHLRGTAGTVWLLDKGTEEIHTSTRAVHILLGELGAGLLVSERLGQPAL